MKRIHFAALLILCLSALSFSLPIASAQQPQCGFVDSISYPVDTTVFKLAQDFSTPNSRHFGYFHTGEDWFGGSAGIPVHVIADGRVTYASPLAWGRDGGVVIVEHTFPDGSIAYSQYGHMQESDTIKFPQKFTCILAGDIVGVVGDARPAPHLHFEIRVNQPDTPGPGYTKEDPLTLGWRRPMQFVTNWQTWMQPYHAWHQETAKWIAPPLELEDHSLMYLERDTLKLLTNDGRVLWRIILEKPAVSITGYLRQALLTYVDGTMQYVSYDGNLLDSWQTNQTFDSAPVDLGTGLLFHSPDNRLIALADNRVDVAWTLDDVSPFKRAYVTGQTIGLLTNDNEALILSRDGRLLDRAQYNDGANFGTLPDTGALLSYSFGGLWTVDTSGTWAFPFEWADTLPKGSESSAVFMDGIERVYLFDGAQLYAYARDSSLLWEIDVPGVEGMTELVKYGTTLLLVSAKGDIAAIGESGVLCNQAQIYSDGRADVWHSLSDDGVLRIAFSGQMIGLGWNIFTQGCS